MSRSFLYVGCYTHESPVGIGVYDSSDPQGHIVEQSVVEGVEHPSFLAAHPSGKFLYAVSETATASGGGVVAFRIGSADGSLSQIDWVPSHGGAPCYVSVDPEGAYLYVANYVSGTIAVYAIAADGRFGELVATHQSSGSGPSPRQEGPHAHCIVPGAGGESVYVADLGTDRVSRFSFDPENEFRIAEDLELKPGCGPRHLAFHPDQPAAFLVCELDSTLAVLGLDPATGRLSERGSYSTLPVDFAGSSIGAEVRVHPNGTRVYVSNRGHDSVAVFGFDGLSEPLVQLGHVPSGGETPRNFAVHPSGRALLVANQDSDSIVPFSIDAATGVPRQLNTSYALSEPVCLTFVGVDS